MTMDRSDAPLGLDTASTSAWDRVLRVALLRANGAGMHEALANGANASGHLDSGTSVLNALIEVGDVSLVVQALARGASVNAPDANAGALTPLHHAVWHDQATIVKALLDRGADPTLTAFDGHDPASTCWRARPLHLAAERAGLEVMALLLNADPSGVLAQDAWSRTPLHLAMLHHRARQDELTGRGGAAVALLLEHGADPDALSHPPGQYGSTPLHAAAQAGLPGAVQRLLNAGADPTRVNARGDTPLAGLRRRRVAGSHEVVAVLERWALQQTLTEGAGLDDVPARDRRRL